MKGMKKADMGGMDMSGMDGTKEEDMAGMDGTTKEMPTGTKGAAPTKDHSGSAENDKQSTSGIDMGTQSMPGMDMNHMDMSSDSAQHDTQISQNKMMAGMEMGSSDGTTPFPQPGPNTMPIMAMAGAEMVGEKLKPSNPVRMHVGPQVDNVPMQVSQRLSDPGAGLGGNGRRVLTYADLRARYRGVDRRPPTREIELHLSGSMERYIWGFNGRKFSSSEPIQLKLGERVRFVLINDTMMEHPIHLHGLWSELENGQGEFNPYKQTVIVKPAERVSYLVSADTPGHWAYHCHLVYHMEAGMFRTVVVS
jgi:FtsP/CotA-like multicopper oxidase with cupredoxin domain